MSKPTFDVTAYRTRLGLTQADLGTVLRLSDPARAIAAWEAHQRSNGRSDYGPSAPAVAYMELLERLWRIYHRMPRSILRGLLAKLLPEKLRENGPKRRR